MSHSRTVYFLTLTSKLPFMKWTWLMPLCLLWACTNHRPARAVGSVDTTLAAQGAAAPENMQETVVKDPALLDKDGYLSYTADAKDIRMYWKRNDTIIQTFQELKTVEPKLLFAMNGGMYTRDYAPVGLYVENGKQLKAIKRYNNPKVNFGLQPQGIFLIRGGVAEVIPVKDYQSKDVQYATQSAPMVVLGSRVNPRLPQSESRNIRNGVGILPNGKVLLVLSRSLVTFQEFARYFVDRGCSAALYLAGGISEAYVPHLESYGSFGVLIGVVNR
jgi:uncharacterized protein YigE (DUF2233 family)